MTEVRSRELEDGRRKIEDSIECEFFILLQHRPLQLQPERFRLLIPY